MKRAKELRQQIFPFLKWFPITAERFKSDLFAGVTVALLLIPQSMAYAELAGMPAYYGLYASIIPVIVGALFGALAQLNSGPTAMTALLSASVVGQYAVPGTPEYIQLTILLTLLIGIIRFIMGSFRLAFIFNIVSHPVIVGFTNASALVISQTQINKIFRMEVIPEHGMFGDIIELIQMAERWREIHLPTLILAIVAALLIIIIKKIKKEIPSVLIVVILATAVSYFFDFEHRFGIRVMGFVPAGLPKFSLVSTSLIDMNIWEILSKFIPQAFVISMMGFIEISSVCKPISNKTKQPINMNQELVAQGLSSIAGSFFMSFPTSSSLSRSAVNYEAGAKSTFSSLITGLTVVLATLFLTPVLYYLPNSVLAISIIISISKLIDWMSVVRAFKARKWDGTVALITFFFTLVVAPNVVYGLIAGVLLSMLGFILRSMKPDMVELGKHYDGTLRSRALHKLQHGTSVLAVRIDGSLYFASIGNAEKYLKRLLKRRPRVRYLLLDLSSVNHIDASGEWGLMQLVEQIRNMSIIIVVSGLRGSSRDVLRNTGVIRFIGRRRDFLNNEEAIDWIKKDMLLNGLDVRREPLLIDKNHSVGE